MRCELADYISIEPPLDVIRVGSRPKKGGTELEIGLVSSTVVVEEGMLEALVEKLGRTFGDFMTNPERGWDKNYLGMLNSIHVYQFSKA